MRAWQADEPKNIFNDAGLFSLRPSPEKIIFQFVIALIRANLHKHGKISGSRINSKMSCLVG
jgi:hypothetical protein